MDVTKAIQERKSIRGYKQDPIPKQVLTEILDLSRFSPSALNAQPWEFLVLTGDSLERAKKGNLECYAAGMEIASYVAEYTLTGVYRGRQVQLAKDLFQLMGIAREDKQKRQDLMRRGLRFFDAPAVILVCMDRSIYDGTSNQMSLADIGVVTQTIALLAVERGLGTCIQFQAAWYPDALRKAVGLPYGKEVILGLAIGYPDWEFPANRIQAQREPLDSLVTWKD